MSSLLSRSPAPRPSSGFSLLEVMVALAILGTAIVAIFQLFSLNLRSTQRAEDHTKAIFYARSMLDEAYSFADPEDESASKEYEKKYMVTREVNLHDESENGKIKVYLITVTAAWPPSGKISIKGLRTVNVSEE